MLLSKVIKQLVNNELGNLSIGKPTWSPSTAFNYDTLIECISLAYIELHKRFTLKKEIITLTPIEGRNQYPLILDHAESNSGSVLDKFIMDGSGTPFSGSIAQVDAVFDIYDERVKFRTTDLNSNISMPDDKTLYIKDITKVPLLTLHLRHVPESLEVSEEDFDTYDLDLSSTYLEALLCYAAGRAYINRGAENATNNESAIFFARFEQACANIMGLGLDNKEEILNEKLHSRGFV